jgi:hypothetical protein
MRKSRFAQQTASERRAEDARQSVARHARSKHPPSLPNLADDVHTA